MDICNGSLQLNNTISVNFILTGIHELVQSFKYVNTNKCGIIRRTNAFYMGSHSLLGSKATSKCEVNRTSGFQATAFTSNILHRYNVNFQTAVATILVFVDCPKSIASELLVVGWLCLTSHRQRGHLETAPPFTVPTLSSIKAVLKCQVNPTSRFQTIAFTSNILHRVQC